MVYPETLSQVGQCLSYFYVCIAISIAPEPVNSHLLKEAQQKAMFVLPVDRAHSRFPGHALTPTGVMAIRCKQFHLPDL